MSEELKSCPFCGDNCKLKVFGSNTDDTLVLSSYVSCENCNSEGPIKRTRPEAITAWNARAGEKDMIQKYRKKPVEIEAMLYTGVQSLQEAIDFCGLHPDFNKWFRDKEEYFQYVANDREVFKIITLEGTMECSPGDYIIKGIKGEFYSCKPDIFKATYEVTI